MHYIPTKLLPPWPVVVVVVVVFSHELIRYESSRGHKIDGTKPNQPGIGDEHGKHTEKDGQEVASKGHRRDKIENINKNTQTVETN